MDTPATVKDSKNRDRATGLTLLDIVKRSLKAILIGLTVNDEFGIVTFSTRAKILFPMTRMTDDAKENSLRQVDGMRTEAMTHLWEGLRLAMTTMQIARKQMPREDINESIFVFTDGVPNDDYAAQGYVVRICL